MAKCLSEGRSVTRMQVASQRATEIRVLSTMNIELSRSTITDDGNVIYVLPTMNIEAVTLITTRSLLINVAASQSRTIAKLSRDNLA